LLPACSATALAQCGSTCSPVQHAQAQHGQKAPTPSQEFAQRLSGERNAERQTLPPCPVTGVPIVLSIRAMTDDGPVYFASEEARNEFISNPRKFADKAADQRQALRKLPRAQVTCPVTGNPIDGKTQILFEDKVIDFCCKNCVLKYEYDPKRDAKLEASYTYQTRCPVSGDPIDPTVSADLGDDLRVYFCCAGDRDAFVKGLRNRTAVTTRPAPESVSRQPDTSKRDKSVGEKKPAGHQGHDGSHP
jgi:hypothetical protein